MAALTSFLDTHHRAVIGALSFVVVFFAAACTFHDAIPICHYLFGCDHALH